MSDGPRVIVDPALLSVRLAALEVAKGKILMQEDKDPEGRGLNTGEIVDWSCDGFTRQRGLAWCGFFFCQCVRHVLRERGEIQQLAHWMKIASGDCDLLWKRMAGEGWTYLWGENGIVPEAGDALFYIKLDKHGERVYHRDGSPNLRHVAFVTEFAPPFVHDLSGNHGDQVGPHKEPIKSTSLYGVARIPF